MASGASAEVPVEAPSPPPPAREGPLPRIPRNDGLPSYADLPEDFRIKNPDKSKKKTPLARLFCFYGCGDSAAQWMLFLNEGAVWCDAVIFECRAHGTREEEPFDANYEERLEDAWESLRPAFAQQAPGGPAEAAPFAFFCHSAGSVMVCLVAARLRAEFGLEPAAVFVADQPPPNIPFLNSEGHKMAFEEPERFMAVWAPHIARMKGTNSLGDAIWSRWLQGLQLLQVYNATSDEAFHVFSCPIYVFLATAVFEDEKAFRVDSGSSRSPERRAVYLEHSRISQSCDPLRFSSWDREQFDLWAKWTTGPCEVVEVESDHFGVWRHIDTEVKLWQEFLRLSGVADILAKQPSAAKRK